MNKAHRRVALLGLALLAVMAVAALAFSRRQPTPAERDNRRVLDAVLTAITLKNARLLEESAGLAQARRDAGHLTRAQHEAMKVFIGKARGGDWSGAEQAGYEFRKENPFVREGQ